MSDGGSAGVEAVRRFVDAFNREDLDTLVAILDPEVELQTRRGIVIGREEARRWATRNPSGELRQRLVVDELREHGNHVLALVRRQWSWRHHPDPADVREFGIVATLRGGLICRWQPFDDRDEAIDVFDRLAGEGDRSRGQ